MSETSQLPTPTIKPIDVTMTQLELLKKVLKNSKVSDTVKERLQKESGFGMCCCCGGIATQKVSYDCAGATRIERYCDSCVEKTFSRIK
jgi:hypothetical protein